MALLLALMALACTLSLFHLGDRGLWADEIVSVDVARDWGRMLASFHSNEATMTLYYLLLHVWLQGGDSEGWVRGLSALMAVSCVPAAWWLGRRLFGPRIGLTFALLLTVNGLFVYYAQEARCYSLFLLLSMTSAIFFVRLVTVGDGASVVGWSVSVTLTMLAHVFGALIPLAHAVSLAFVDRRRVPWRRLAQASALAVALLAAYVLTLRPTVYSSLHWLAAPSFRDVVRLFHDYSSWSLPLLFAYAALAGVAVVRGANARKWPEALVLTLFGAPMLVSLAYSYLVAPAWFPRYLIPCLAPMLLLVAMGIAKIRSRRARAALLGVLVTLSLRGVLTAQGFARDDWRACAAFIRSEARQGDAVAGCPRAVSQYFAYYWNPSPVAGVRLLDVASGEGLQSDNVPWSDQGERCTADRLPDDPARYWLIMWHEQFGAAERIRRVLARHYVLAGTWDDAGMTIQLYQRATPRNPARGPEAPRL